MYNNYYDQYDRQPENENQGAQEPRAQEENRQEVFRWHSYYAPQHSYTEDPVTDEIARRYMASLLDHGIDTLIMGCTHYPLIRKTIGRAAGDMISLINPAYETAMELRQMLGEMNLLADHRPALGSTVPQYRFYVSDMAEQFQQFANSIIKYGILASEKIDIYNYSGKPFSAEEGAG